MSAQHYSPGTAAGIRSVLSRLSLWMQAVGAEVDDIDAELLAQFVARERSREVICASAMRSVGTLCRFLRDAGYLHTPEVASGPASPALAVVAMWTAWMREECGLTEKTVAARVNYAAGLLDVLTEPDGELGWTRLGASQINSYVAERGLGYGVVTVRTS